MLEERPDKYEDILARDKRYELGAYYLLEDVVGGLCTADGNTISGEYIMDEFKEMALDKYGPLAYTVLREWGVNSTEDIGEMVFNLVESHRLLPEEGDSKDAFANGYDFKEAFLGPYEP